ncbi:SprT-like domain-containing protein [Spiroplasma endosymbiont of Aspidapion aeneum]|uniref:SprT-like domain-containing protein n=1 Tax=Spiroplasma endosymbiont of Aspidapion aeneum TaxID=3066276 RepID=UPI00313D2168
MLNNKISNMENKKTLIIDLIGQLHNVHSQINRILFDNKLKDVNITINGLAKRRVGCSVTLGIYSHLIESDRNIFSNNAQLITINNYALTGDIYQIIAVLIHEMCHQMNHELKIQDTNGKRHNAFFKEMALKAKLNVDRDGWRGYSSTSPTNELLDIINSLDIDRHIFEDIVYFDNYKIIEEKLLEEKIDKEQKLKISREKIVDYSCAKCNYKFRLRQEVNIRCETCNEPLLVEKPYID